MAFPRRQAWQCSRSTYLANFGREAPLSSGHPQLLGHRGTWTSLLQLEGVLLTARALVEGFYLQQVSILITYLFFLRFVDSSAFGLRPLGFRLVGVHEERRDLFGFGLLDLGLLAVYVLPGHGCVDLRAV